MTHRRVNDALTVVVVVVALYVLLAPLLPNLTFWWGGLFGNATPAYVAAATDGQGQSADSPVPTENRIVIPKIRADAQIYQGATDAVLEQGTWLRPKTPTPPNGGNTVIVGHRFSYNPGIDQPFYHLDKLDIGDKIVIAWEGKVYTYEVSEIRVVNKTQTEVEAPTTERQLTLYTCTPLWNPVNRLVIVAKGVN